MPRKVTVGDMVEAIREKGRPCTKRDIADGCGVSRQTIANHSDELESDDRVAYGQVGTANAYWLASWSDDDPDPPLTHSDDDSDDSDATQQDSGQTSTLSRLGSGQALTKGVAVVLVGYGHLLPAQWAASAEYGTIAAGMLLLVGIFTVFGLALILLSLIANIEMATANGAGTDTAEVQTA